MTEKENFMRIVNGLEPGWVPRYGVIPGQDPRFKPACQSPMISMLRKRGPDGVFRDVFGVEYTPTESTGGMALPTPGRFILDDITKWRDVIKAPSLEDYDWDKIVADAMKNINREEVAVALGAPGSYFQALMAFMGFTEGLCAMYEEPEEVMALMDYLGSFYDEITRNLIDRVKPDIFSIADDTATALNPFISPDMYRELIKPFHARQCSFAQERGIPVNMHNCGRCEDSIDDWREFGVRMWNPAQVMNDLPAIKKKYGNSLVLIGCWDSSGPVGWPGASEELVRSEVRRVIDTYAVGGGFMFWGSVCGDKEDPEVKQRGEWIADEVYNYGHAFYKH